MLNIQARLREMASHFSMRRHSSTGISASYPAKSMLREVPFTQLSVLSAVGVSLVAVDDLLPENRLLTGGQALIARFKETLSYFCLAFCPQISN